MQGGCGPVVRSVNREEALLVHSGTSAEALRSVSSLLVEVEELEAPLFGSKRPREVSGVLRATSGRYSSRNKRASSCREATPSFSLFERRVGR
jgi:hypothetical protein